MKKRYGLSKKFISLFLLITSLFCFNKILFAETFLEKQQVYFQHLLKVAEEKKLYNQKYWHILLHYRDFLIGGRRSVIDDPDFFLSPDGKSDPKAELEATLRAFFVPVNETDGEKKHPVCRFLARYNWLDEQLNFDKSFFPLSECQQYEKVIKKIGPESAILIFPTGHINSPASMFGHTLLIIKTKNKSKLLAHAINYAANTNETFGPIYAFKGLFGFYKGYFSILPYYLKIQEYSDVDLRDIWEYPLNLSTAEVNRLVMHLTELENIYSDYFFFDENCSYNLLFLLEAARPSLNLVEKFYYNLAISPIDTIRVINDSNLIETINYRPSRATKIKRIAGLLDDEKQSLAYDICDNKIEPNDILNQEFSEEDKIKIFDLAGEYAKYLNAKEKISKEKYKNLFVGILKARSLLGQAGEYVINVPSRPLESHKIARLALASGVRGDDFFTEVRYRPSYHSLLDNDKGYVKGSQVIFSNLALRYYPIKNELALNNFDFIDIMSTSPIDKFFRAASWKFKTGFRQKYFDQDDSALIYQFVWGIGGTLQFKYLDFLYFMFEPEIDLGKRLDDYYAIGLGGEIGVVHQMNSFWKASLFLKNHYYPLGEDHNELDVGLKQHFYTGQDSSVMINCLRKKSFDFSQNEFSVGYNFFF